MEIKFCTKCGKPIENEVFKIVLIKYPQEDKIESFDLCEDCISEVHKYYIDLNNNNYKKIMEKVKNS